MEARTEELPIPPLDPAWWQTPGGLWPQPQPMPMPSYREVIFTMREEDYAHRMRHEALRLRREEHLEKTQLRQTELIKRQREQIEELQTFKTPSVEALRQAYVEDKITLEEFDRLVLHCISGQS